MKMYFASDMIERNYSRKSKVVGRIEESDNNFKYDRPKKRHECPVQRPCPFITCRHNLYIDVRDSGNITFNFYEMPIEMMEFSCAIDIANENPSGMPLGKIGDIMNLTRERVRQIEIEASEKLKKKLV